MLSIFPPRDGTEGIDFSWDQLTLGVNTQSSYPEIVEDFWRRIVPMLNKIKNVDIKGPDEEAWFHLRRMTGPNCYQSGLRYAQARIEIFRLKRGFITQDTQEEIRLLLSKHGDVICAGWWGLNFTGRHDNAFLSFLQSLSVLRGRDRIFYKAYLANISDEYDRCPYCQEAYKIMMTAGSPWFEALKPWFAYISSTNMDRNRSHEYAHWFGHILSGWP
jgi:hypothetical protein